MRLGAIEVFLPAVIMIVMAAGGTARATTFDLETVTWQKRSALGPALKFLPIQALELSKDKKTTGHFVARLKFLNRGPSAEGILIRYSVEAKIAPEDHPESSSWVVPFLLDERRVPKVAANSYFEVPLDPSTMTDIYIKNLALEGYTVQALRLRTMISPRRGQPGPIQVLESELPVAWKAP